MTRDEIESKIKEILVSDFELDAEKLVPGAKLFEDLDLDSIDAVDMVVRLQQITGLKVKAEDFKQIRTLDDVVGVVEKLVNEQGK
jgi:acyl carrier protein